MSALTDAATALVAEIAADIAVVKTEATEVADLTAKNADLAAKLDAALKEGDPAQVQALQAESALVAGQLVQATADLHGAIDAVHPVAPAPAA